MGQFDLKPMLRMPSTVRICRGFQRHVVLAKNGWKPLIYKGWLSERDNPTLKKNPAFILEETMMQTEEQALEAQTLDAQIARDKQVAKVFWWILMAMRAVIPIYVGYAIYLYWTLPHAVRWSGGGY